MWNRESRRGGGWGEERGRENLTQPNSGWTLRSWWSPWPETWDMCEPLSGRTFHATVSWEHLCYALHTMDLCPSSPCPIIWGANLA